MYKLTKNIKNQINGVAIKQGDILLGIPFAPDNTDYAKFKKQILADEAQLQDADGNLMTPEEAQAYIKELP